MIVHDLEHEKEHEIERATEAQIVKYLHEHIQFDLPRPFCETKPGAPWVNWFSEIVSAAFRMKC